MKKIKKNQARRWFWFYLLMSLLTYVDLGILYANEKWFWFLIYLGFSFCYTYMSAILWSIGYGGR